MCASPHSVEHAHRKKADNTHSNIFSLSSPFLHKLRNYRIASIIAPYRPLNVALLIFSVLILSSRDAAPKRGLWDLSSTRKRKSLMRVRARSASSIAGVSLLPTLVALMPMLRGACWPAARAAAFLPSYFGRRGAQSLCSGASRSIRPPALAPLHNVLLYRNERSRPRRNIQRCLSGSQGPGVGEKTEEEKARLKAEREARKAEKQRKAAEKKAKKAAEAAAREAANRIDDVTFLSVDEQDQYQKMGDMTTVMSRSRTGRHFANVADLGADDDAKHKPGSTVWLRGRLYSIRVKGGSCFLVLRQDSFHTVQAVYFKDKGDPEGSQRMIRYLKSLTVESVVDIEGTISEAEVRSCSVKDVEVNIERIYTVSKAAAILPFLVEDAARSEEEVTKSQETERPFPRLGQELRLDHRWMDLRAPANNAIMRIQSAVCQLFRESLYSQGFVEIHTPKLIAGESESGAEVFRTDYFGRSVCLAQSPQLYKQMAISSDLPRVFEIGPVFRAENSNTRRHLCEFVGLDLEMAIEDSYMEALDVIHDMFKHIFTGLESRFGKELSVIREQYHSEPVEFTDDPCVLHWPEAMDILREKGFDVGDGMGDLTGAQELALGEAVKEKYGTDFFMLDKYPFAIRPFYTMPDPDDGRFSNSYDIFIRGLEICSGAQRCHDPDLLMHILEEKGVEPGEGLMSYVESFRHGVCPHAGAGVGLERVVFLYLGLDNVRKASMFPRDPNRCTP